MRDPPDHHTTTPSSHQCFRKPGEPDKTYQPVTQTLPHKSVLGLDLEAVNFSDDTIHMLQET